jgi:hypothetical protein
VTIFFGFYLYTGFAGSGFSSLDIPSSDPFFSGGYENPKLSF